MCVCVCENEKDMAQVKLAQDLGMHAFFHDGRPFDCCVPHILKMVSETRICLFMIYTCGCVVVIDLIEEQKAKILRLITPLRDVAVAHARQFTERYTTLLTRYIYLTII